jgi:hypothetical protein
MNKYSNNPKGVMNRCFLDVRRVHRHLMIPLDQIDNGKKFATMEFG